MADQEKNEQTQMSLEENEQKMENDGNKADDNVTEPQVNQTSDEVSVVQQETGNTNAESSANAVLEGEQQEASTASEPALENTLAVEQVMVDAPANMQSIEEQKSPVEQGVPKGPIPGFMQTAGNQPKVTNEEKIWALISYIPLMAVMSLVLQPKSEFIKLHGRQGLLIFLIFFFSIFVYLVPYIGPVIGIFVHMACIGVGIFSMYQAFIGNWWKIPVLGDIAELIPVEMFVKVTRSAVMGPTEGKIQEQQDDNKAKEAEALNSNISEQK